MKSMGMLELFKKENLAPVPSFKKPKQTKIVSFQGSITFYTKNPKTLKKL